MAGKSSKSPWPLIRKLHEERHLPNEQHELGERDALERLAALSLLARWITEANIEAAS
jgi:hypothetical protein